MEYIIIGCILLFVIIDTVFFFKAGLIGHLQRKWYDYLPGGGFIRFVYRRK